MRVSNWASRYTFSKRPQAATISFLLTSRNIRAGQSDRTKWCVNRVTVVFRIRLDLRDALFASCLIKEKDPLQIGL
jgi:hypothetical protein